MTAWFHVTMDSLVEKAILVHVNDNRAYKFRECGQGLYYLDTEHLVKLPKPNSTKNQLTSTLFSQLYPIIRNNSHAWKSKERIKRMTLTKSWAGHLIKPSSLPSNETESSTAPSQQMTCAEMQ